MPAKIQQAAAPLAKMTDIRPIRRALISVADKQQLILLAQALSTCGVEILASGGSAQQLRAANIVVKEVSEHTNSPEMMNGRVKTLHPIIHGGILARDAADEAQAAGYGITPIDLVVVNLYPFAQTIARRDCTPQQAIEQIDIGGPTLIRAAAKNHQRVAVLCDPNDYSELITQLQQQGGLTLATRQALAAKAFAYTAAYEDHIANYFAQQQAPDKLPTYYNQQWQRQQPLRYGENPQQQAALYVPSHSPRQGMGAIQQLQGKALSYNNLQDANSAWQLARTLSDAACVIVKHNNPCGAAQSHTMKQAYEQALAADPQSAFGGIVACHGCVDETCAQAMISQQFIEVIIGNHFTDDALRCFAQKNQLRVLRIPLDPPDTWQLTSLDHALLLQSHDNLLTDTTSWRVVSEKQPSDDMINDLLFAQTVVKYARSNAIVLAKNQAVVGIGSGCVSRVSATTTAIANAQQFNQPLHGAVLGSDAFFPFSDSIEQAAKVGIAAIIQPGGSKRDAEVIACANKHHIVMVLTGIRHFKH